MAGYRFGKQAQFGTGNYMTHDANNIGMVVGSSNTLSGSRVMIVGNNNISIDGSADGVVIGHANTLSGGADDSLLVGRFNTSNHSNSIALGEGCSVQHAGTLNLGNYLATAAGGIGPGSAQQIIAVLRAKVTDATPTVLTLRDSGLLTIADGMAWRFRADVVAKALAGVAEHAFYHVSGILNRTGATTSMLSTPATVTTILESTGTMALACTANDTNDSLEFKFTGKAATAMEIVASVEITQVAVSTA